MIEPTEIQILAALEQSGYLFEQQVADKLEELDLHVDTSWAFPDPDLGKSRELDVRAIRRVFNDEQNQLAVFVELLVECKAFEAPMVFLQRPKNEREKLHSAPREYTFPIHKYKKQTSSDSYTEVPAFIHLSLKDHHYYYRESTKSSQFSKIVRKGSDWTANHEGIYDSIVLPLAKALEFRRKEEVKLTKGPGWRYVWLYFPIVVLRQGLYALDVTADSKSLKSRGRVTFVRHLESGNVKGFYMIDFVRFDHLDEYFKVEIQPFVDHIVSIASTKPQQLLNADA